MKQYLVDTSVWIDFFRGIPGGSHDVMKDLGQDTDCIATTEPVIMELRAGAVGTRLARIEGTLNRFAQLGVQPTTDFFVAADLYRQVRRNGNTVRSMVDCLIAAVAIRTGATLVHRDRDYALLADIATELRVRSALD
ncbi:MAG: PIN domain nuclease [Saccharopolyspora sp.]|uniref:type II toxin-antitoxin system VapC family toxin n=1 Tax=unclassified Saccharopolyspora TaxID=2646250 RepID=UPI0025F450F3|nr:PIN domain nuclease [Saccharopolyspora sp.]MBQ6640483.1 PIN domain nuclease [Saccharopolyspora sp.]